MFNFFNMVLTVASDVSIVPEAPTGILGFIAQYGSFLFLGLVFVAMYFLMIRPNKKKEKAAAEKRSSIEVGDEVTTIGGVVGRVVNVKEEAFVMETGGDRTRMRFKKWAIQDVNKLELETPGDGISTGKDAKPAKSGKDAK